MRWFSIEDFTQCAETGIQQMILQWFEIGLRQGRIAGHTVYGQCVVTQQPSPDRTLMVGGVPFPDSTLIPGLVVRVARL